MYSFCIASPPAAAAPTGATTVLSGDDIMLLLQLNLVHKNAVVVADSR